MPDPAPVAPVAPPDPAQQLAELQAQLAKGQSDMERLKASTKQAEAQLMREAVKVQAITAGVLDTALLDHLPIQGCEIKDGRVVGADVAVGNLRTSFPKIFGQPPAAVQTPPAPAPVAAPVAPPPPVPVAIAAVPPPPNPAVGLPPQTKVSVATPKAEYRAKLEEQRAALSKLG